MALWLYDMLNFPFAGKAQKIIYKRKKGKKRSLAKIFKK